MHPGARKGFARQITEAGITTAEMRVLDIGGPQFGQQDFERGFIAAEVVHFDDLVTLGSKAAAREVGKLRIEGKEYVVKDGDVLNFLFNV